MAVQWARLVAGDPQLYPIRWYKAGPSATWFGQDSAFCHPMWDDPPDTPVTPGVSLHPSEWRPNVAAWAPAGLMQTADPDAMLNGAPPDAPNGTVACGVPTILTAGGISLGGSAYAGMAFTNSACACARPITYPQQAQAWLSRACLCAEPDTQPATWSLQTSAPCLRAAATTNVCTVGAPAYVSRPCVCLSAWTAGPGPCQPAVAGPTPAAWLRDPDYGWLPLAWNGTGFFQSRVLPNSEQWVFTPLTATSCLCAFRAGTEFEWATDTQPSNTLLGWDATTGIGTWSMVPISGFPSRLDGRRFTAQQDACGAQYIFTQACLKGCPQTSFQTGDRFTSSPCAKGCPSTTGGGSSGYTGCSFYPVGVKGTWTGTYSGFSSDCSAFNQGSVALPPPASGCSWSVTIGGNVTITMTLASATSAGLTLTSSTPLASITYHCSTFTANGPNVFSFVSGGCTTHPASITLTGS